MMGTGNSTLGTVDGHYADRKDGHPTFATVTTGASGSKTSLVPLDRAEFSGEQVTAPDDKDKVAGAPTTMS